jgi:muramoyltetrapeptide carboxypeptidase
VSGYYLDPDTFANRTPLDRLDRMLTQLLRADEFQGIVAIAIGQLLGADTSSYTALELLDRTLGSLGLPIITGLSIGHNTTTSLPIVLGALAEVDSNLGQLRVSVPAVSNLANSSKQGF